MTKVDAPGMDERIRWKPDRTRVRRTSPSRTRVWRDWRTWRRPGHESSPRVRSPGSDRTGYFLS